MVTDQSDGGRVIDPKGLAPTVMAGTHGYGFGCVLVYEEDYSDQHRGGLLQMHQGGLFQDGMDKFHQGNSRCEGWIHGNGHIVDL